MKFILTLWLSLTTTSVFCQSLFNSVFELKQDPVGALSGKGDLFYFMHGKWLKTANMTVKPLTILDSIEINEDVKQLFVNDDKLFVLSSDLIIYSITNPEKPSFLTSIALPKICNWVTSLNNKIYLATSDGILFGDLTAENTITFDVSFGGRNLLWLDLSDSLLVTQSENCVYSFNTYEKVEPTFIDSLIYNGYFTKNIAVYKNKIFLPGISYYEVLSENKFKLIGKIPSYRSFILYRSGDFLFSRYYPGEVGFAMRVIDLNDWPDYKVKGEMYSYDYYMSTVYGNSEYMVMTGNPDGLIIYKNNGEEEFAVNSHDYLSFPSSESSLYKNHVFLNSTSGYRIYKYDEQFNLSLVQAYDQPPNDFGPFPEFHFEFFADTAYINRAFSIGRFDIKNETMGNNFYSVLINPIGGMSFSGKYLWTFSGNPYTSNLGYGFDLSNWETSLPSNQKVFFHPEYPHNITSDSNYVFLSSKDSLRIYAQSNYESLFSVKQSIHTGGIPYHLLKYDSLLICQNNSQNIVIYKEQPDGFFKQISTIPIPTEYYNSTFNIIDNFLIVPHNSQFYVYDLIDPNNPELAEILPSYGNNSTSVGVDGNQIILGYGSRGFSIYQYKGRPTSVQLPNHQPFLFSLNQNYPNPFNPNTVISYQLSVISDVKLVVFDLLGREVATLVNEKKAAGSYTASFDGANLTSGVYLYKLTAGNYSETRKMTLVK